MSGNNKCPQSQYQGLDIKSQTPGYQTQGKPRKKRTLNIITYCERHLDGFQHGSTLVCYAQAQKVPTTSYLFYNKRYQKQGEVLTSSSQRLEEAIAARTQLVQIGQPSQDTCVIMGIFVLEQWAFFRIHMGIVLLQEHKDNV